MQTASSSGKRPGRSALFLSLLTVGILLLAACASAPGAGTPNPDPPDPLPPAIPPSQPVASVSDQLTELGVPVSSNVASNRLLAEGIEIEAEYSPLGYRARLAASELLAVGVTVPCAGAPFAQLAMFPLFDHGSGSLNFDYACSGASIAVLQQSSPSGEFNRPGAQSSRTITAGALTSDAAEAGLLLNAVENPDGQVDIVPELLVPGPSGPTIDRSTILSPFSLGEVNVLDLAAAVTDLDGDGLDDVMIAVVTEAKVAPSGSQLRVFATARDYAGNFTSPFVQPRFTHDVPADVGSVSVRLAVGNLDLDPQSESAVVLRTMKDVGMDDPEASVTYWVFDHMTNGDEATVLETGLLELDSQPFLTADVTIGDFDGDSLGELAFAGVLAFPLARDFCTPYTFGYLIRDDLVFQPSMPTVASLVESHPAGTCGSSSGNKGIVYEVLAGSINFTGGRASSLVANDRILALVEGKLAVTRRMSDFYEFTESNSHFSEATVSIAIGDFDNDGLEDVAFFDTELGLLRIEGLNESYEQYLLVENGNDFHPLLVAYDNDNDGMVVEYNLGSHRVVHTEPLIMAVMAAPPYSVDFGQDPQDVSTSYGVGSSTSVSSETTISVTASATLGASVGVNLGTISLETEYMLSLSKEMEKAQGTGYTTTTVDTYTVEGTDGVVYTSVPFDLYDYTIVATKDPDLLGSTMTVMLPREPFTRPVPVDYYNARVPEGSLLIDDSILSHTVGDVSSYMSHAGMRAIRDKVELGHYGPTAFLQNTNTATVGHGATSTNRSLSMEQENFNSNSVGYSVEHSVGLTTGGVFTGFSTGSGSGHSVTYATGSSTTVTSEVPGVTVDEALFPGSVYSFGMFTYMHRAGNPDDPDGQLFQVVNFWVP